MTLLRLLTTLSLLVLFSAGFATETITQIPLAPQASTSPYNHVNQVAISATEVGVQFTFAVTGYTSFVQLVSTESWTYRGTSGSSTDAVPVAANQVFNILVQPIGQTIYAVGSGAGTLYVIPLTFGRPLP